MYRASSAPNFASTREMQNDIARFFSAESGPLTFLETEALSNAPPAGAEGEAHATGPSSDSTYEDSCPFVPGCQLNCRPPKVETAPVREKHYLLTESELADIVRRRNEAERDREKRVARELEEERHRRELDRMEPNEPPQGMNLSDIRAAAEIQRLLITNMRKALTRGRGYVHAVLRDWARIPRHLQDPTASLVLFSLFMERDENKHEEMDFIPFDYFNDESLGMIMDKYGEAIARSGVYRLGDLPIRLRTQRISTLFIENRNGLLSDVPVLQRTRSLCAFALSCDLGTLDDVPSAVRTAEFVALSMYMSHLDPSSATSAADAARRMALKIEALKNDS